MVRSSNTRVAVCAALACVAVATANVICLLYIPIAEGRALTTIEDAFLDLSIGVLVLVLLGWWALRHRSRRWEQYQRKINEEARKLDTAISHMSQGLVMFDASHRLVLCNSRYFELNGISADVVKPGLSFRDLLSHRKEVGSFFGDVDETCNRIEASLADGK
jgi:PAS domain-containing protein